jgi:hypothetical protein
MYEPHHHHHHHQPQSNENDDNELVNEIIPENDISHTNSRTTIHWRPDREGDMNIKQKINTDTEYFDALFARSNASPPPSPHPRCYSSCSPSTIPFQIFTDTSSHNYAKSQPHLISSSSPYSVKQYEARRKSTVSSVKSQQSNPTLSPNSAQMKRKTFSLTHSAQAFLQSANSHCEQLEPLARSCSYKRPQSIKKYRQQKKSKEKEKEKEKEQKEYFPSRKYSTHNNNILHTVISDSTRKSVSSATSRVSAIDLMATDDPHDQWSNPKTNRSGRVGKIKITDFIFFFFRNESLISHKKKKTKSTSCSRNQTHTSNPIDHGNICKN